MANHSLEIWQNVTNVSTDIAEEIPGKATSLALYTSITAVISILGLSLNGYVFLVLLRSKLFQKKRMEFIQGMCISDILFGTSGLMFVLKWNIEYLSLNAVYCVFLKHLMHSAIAHSLTQTFLVCLERYLAVADDIRFRKLTKIVKYRLSVCTWIVVEAYFVVMTISFLSVHDVKECRDREFPYFQSFRIGVSAFCLPLLIATVTLYSYLVLVHMRKMMKTAPENTDVVVSFQSRSGIPTFLPPHSEPGRNFQVNPFRHADSTRTQGMKGVTKNNRQKEYVVVITTGLIMACLVVLTGPFVVTQGIRGMELAIFPKHTIFITILMTGLNSLLNPIIYVFRIPCFKGEAYSIFCNCHG